MAKKTRLSVTECKPVKDPLCKAKFKSPGILARLLLEAFIFEDGDINSDWFVREKVCTKGKFTKLRDRLIEEHWLSFREDSRRYFPGIRLKPNLDALKAVKWATLADLEGKVDRTEFEQLDEKKADKGALELTRAQLAKTNEQLAKTNRQLASTNQRIEEIASAVRELQVASLPPDDEEKKAIRAKSTKRIASLACSN